MKRFWLTMLTLGLVLAFSASAMAVDVKFSGSFYAAGMYLDKVTLKDKIANVVASAGDDPQNGTSTAFYYQRLRVQTDFIVSPGLKLVTRFDAMERIWGGARSATTTVDSAGTKTENENIAFDWAYINYASAIGTFDVGYMNYGATGTIFGNSSTPQARIKYSYTIGPATINAAISKTADNSNSYVNTATIATDADNDVYHLEGVYAWKNGKAGVNFNYYRSASTKRQAAAPPPYLTTVNFIKTYFLFTPYAIAKIGPLTLQAEFNFATGKSKLYDSNVVFAPTNVAATDVDLDNISGWIDATADFGKFYLGGTFAYISGDDPGTTDKEEGGTLTGGIDWNPTLIMFNQDRTYWVNAAGLGGYNSTTNASAMSNAWFFQGRVGAKPLAALDIMASVSFANADKKPAWPATNATTGALIYAAGTGVLNNSYGWELDVTGTYKITNNLSYMLGAGYLWTGDYYQGISQEQGLNNNYMLINKLTLTF